MLTAFFKAATAFFNAWPLFVASNLQSKIHDIEDEIFAAALDGSPSAKLRLEQLAKRRERFAKSLSALRPTDTDAS